MKWAIMLLGAVAAWIVNAWYILILIGVLHSWWLLLPAMGWYTSLIVSGLVVIAVVAGQFIAAFTSVFIKELK